MSTLQTAWRIAKAVGLGKLSRSLAASWPFPVSTPINSGGRMYVDLRSSIGRGIFATGAFDQAAIEPALAALKEGGVFLDIGANIGYYSVLASHLVGKGGRVFAFEMDPRPLRCLRKTIAAVGHKNIRIVECAVSDSDGVLSFVPEREHGHNRIGRPGETGPMVRSVRMDSWVEAETLRRIDVIKIDVEGAERLVLEGGRRTIERFRPMVLCETGNFNAGFGGNSQEIADWLRGRGYQVEWLKDVFSPMLLARPVEKSSGPLARSYGAKP